MWHSDGIGGTRLGQNFMASAVFSPLFRIPSVCHISLYTRTPPQGVFIICKYIVL
jgi:hypothetical protein